jgi:hypothetical protein
LVKIVRFGVAKVHILVLCHHLVWLQVEHRVGRLPGEELDAAQGLLGGEGWTNTVTIAGEVETLLTNLHHDLEALDVRIDG